MDEKKFVVITPPNHNILITKSATATNNIPQPTLSTAKAKSLGNSKKRKNCDIQGNVKQSDHNFNVALQRPFLNHAVKIESFLKTNPSYLECHFTPLAQIFCDYITQWKPDAIVSCMYQLSSTLILNHLIKEKIPCGFILQKSSKLWKRNLEKKSESNKKKHKSKNTLKDNIQLKNRMLYDRLIPYPFDQNDAVTCCGSDPKMKTPSPLMHHKFVIFLKRRQKENPELHPVGVWMGSFNFTQNACNGYEDVTVFRNETQCDLYFNEWKLLKEKCAESLDWKSSLIQLR